MFIFRAKKKGILVKMKIIKQMALLVSLLIVLASCGSDDGTDPIDDTDDGMNTEFLGEIEFVRTYGGSNEDDIVSFQATSDGGIIAAGYTKSIDGDIIDKTEDDSDFWVLRTDQQGGLMWSRTYGGSSDDRARSISPTSDGGYVVSGYTRSDDGDVQSGNEGFNDFWVIKINGSGDLLWEKSFGFAGSDQAFDIFETNDGGFFVTGILDVTASGGEGNTGRNAGLHAGGDYWNLKLNASGELIWSRYYGGTFTDTAHMAVETGNGDFIIIGFSDSTDVDISNNKGGYDFWVVRVANDGTLIWEKSYGGSEIDIPYAITKTNDGNYIIVGDTRSTDIDVSNPIGNADIWAIKIDDNGSMLWEQTYGGTQFESARGIRAASEGNYVIAASTRSADGDIDENKGQNDAWALVIDSDGTLQFDKTVGGSDLDFANDALITSDNKIYVIGNTESNDLDVTENKGIKDFLLIKIQ
jgi:hypothetical protein